MDKEDKKRRMGQNVAFYTALAVCLIAVGVGTWQLLQPEGAAPDAQSGAAAVSSSAAALPDAQSGADAEASISPDASENAASAVMGPDAPEASGVPAERDVEETVTPQAVSGAAAVPTDAKNAGNASSSKDAGNAAKSDAKSDASSNAKSATNSNSKSAESSNAKSGSSSNGKSAASGAKSDAKSSKSSNASKRSGDAVRPVEGAVVTAYSMDKLLYNETMRDWRTHDGIDIAADAGTAVVAAKAGTVESVEADPIMGMTVTIQHQDKWETVYSSLTDAPEVEAGDEVAAGQVVGYVGETAASESALGPHLHFAVLHDGAASDPESFLA